MNNLKVAFYNAGGCGGCDMSILDLSDFFINFSEKFDIVFWTPLITDFKYKDLDSIPAGYIDFGFFSGNLNNPEHENIAKMMRNKCKNVIAFGICASEGGIRALANLYSPEKLINTAYIKTISNDDTEKIIPLENFNYEMKYDLSLPSLKEVKTLSHVINVDYYIGGCPPHHEHIKRIIDMILNDKLPSKGSWLTNGNSVCELCERNSYFKGEAKSPVKTIKRIHEGNPDPDRCLLEQGYLCLGPLTQGDCGCRCPNVNIPCAGCGGPLKEVKDFGSRAISTIASLFENEELVEMIPSPVFLFYRYTLAEFTSSNKILIKKGNKK